MKPEIETWNWNLKLKFCFGSTALSFCFSLGQILGLFALFGPFGAIFGVNFRVKINFWTYLCRQSTMVFEVQPYLFVFALATFEDSFALFLALLGYSLACYPIRKINAVHWLVWGGFRIKAWRIQPSNTSEKVVLPTMVFEIKYICGPILRVKLAKKKTL